MNYTLMHYLHGLRTQLAPQELTYSSPGMSIYSITVTAILFIIVFSYFFAWFGTSSKSIAGNNPSTDASTKELFPEKPSELIPTGPMTAKDPEPSSLSPHPPQTFQEIIQTSTAMFVQCSQVLLRSHVSAVNQNDGTLTHVYYQDNDSSISVIYKNGSVNSDPSWGGGDNATVLAAGKAVLGTPLATIMWKLNGLDEYRTYYLNPSFEICENALSQPNDGGKWHAGGLDGLKLKAAPYSKLSAIFWLFGGVPHIRVYYQATDDKIHEVCFEGVWATGPVLPGSPLHGTSLAFVQRSRSTGPSIRGYYQETNRTLNELAWDSGWSMGTHIGATPLPFRTAITATVPPGAEDQWIRVYYVADGSQNQIAEFYWHNGWSGPFNLPFSSNVNVPSTQLAAVSFFRGDEFTSQPDVRIYVQQPYLIWNEVACTKGTWSGSNGLRGVGIRLLRSLEYGTRCKFQFP